jgi:hypothetical protein
MHWEMVPRKFVTNKKAVSRQQVYLPPVRFSWFAIISDIFFCNKLQSSGLGFAI